MSVLSGQEVLLIKFSGLSFLLVEGHGSVWDSADVERRIDRWEHFVSQNKLIVDSVLFYCTVSYI